MDLPQPVAPTKTLARLRRTSEDAARKKPRGKRFKRESKAKTAPKWEGSGEGRGEGEGSKRVEYV